MIMLSDIRHRIEITSSSGRVPVVDLSQRTMGVADLAAFQRAGMIVVRGAIGVAEQRDVGEACRRLIDRAWQAPGQRDFMSSVFTERAESALAEDATGFCYEPSAEVSLGEVASSEGGSRIGHADYWTSAQVEPEPR